MSDLTNYVRPIRVLAVDDDSAILEAYRKILTPRATGSSDLDALEAKLFGGDEEAPAGEAPVEASYCHQAEEAVAAIASALAEGNPFALVFLDMRMPPGRDGAWAAKQIRSLDQDVGIVIATAFSDISPREIAAGVPPADKLFYLQKPFHPHEVRQLAAALGTKWCAERDLLRSERLNLRLGRVVDNAPSEIFVLDAENFQVIQANQRATTNLGYTLAELTEMDSLDLLPDLPESELRERLSLLAAGTEDHVQLKTRIRRKDGSSYAAEIKLHLSVEESPPVVVAITSDISERLRAEEKIHRLAYYDAVTGLPNINLFIYGLERALVQARRKNERLAVIFLDLDQFMRINDTLDHDVGDLLLKNVVTRLVASVRETDLVCRGEYGVEEENVARLGGNEFTVLVDKISDISDAARVAERLIQALSQPEHLNEGEVVLTPSIGISIFPDDGDDVQTLLKNADTARYHAKEAGSSTFKFFALEMNDRALERLNLETGLCKAVEREELVLNYQPLVEAQSGKLASVEALLRWHSSELGLVSPACFIPIAEDTGLIASVGRWVVGEAVRQVKAWGNTDLPPISVAVNLSSRQFRNSATLLSMIRETIEETGISPEQLQFELTEGTIMDNVDTMIQILRDLKDLGCSLSLDDFGTGYSSLSYLKRLPLDALKIDRSFVADIEGNADDAAITDAIIAMGHRLNLEVVAEGVETQEQFDRLKDQGVDIIQGFLFSKPLPADEFLAFAQRTWPATER